MLLASVLSDHARSAADTFGFAAVVSTPVRRATLRQGLLRAFADTDAAPEAAPALDQTMAERCWLDILVAEDNPVNQAVIRLMLERLGYAPDIVANGRTAVEAAGRRSYDLILMDLQMPEMGGNRGDRGDPGPQRHAAQDRGDERDRARRAATPVQRGRRR